MNLWILHPASMVGVAVEMPFDLGQSCWEHAGQAEGAASRQSGRFDIRHMHLELSSDEAHEALILSCSKQLRFHWALIFALRRHHFQTVKVAMNIHE